MIDPLHHQSFPEQVISNWLKRHTQRGLALAAEPVAQGALGERLEVSKGKRCRIYHYSIGLYRISID